MVAIDPDLAAPYAAHSGSAFAYSGAIENSYERRLHTIARGPGIAGAPLWVESRHRIRI